MVVRQYISVGRYDDTGAEADNFAFPRGFTALMPVAEESSEKRVFKEGVEWGASDFFRFYRCNIYNGRFDGIRQFGHRLPCLCEKINRVT